jgi:hypothetical protein
MKSSTPVFEDVVAVPTPYRTPPRAQIVVRSQPLTSTVDGTDGTDWVSRRVPLPERASRAIWEGSAARRPKAEHGRGWAARFGSSGPRDR